MKKDPFHLVVFGLIFGMSLLAILVMINSYDSSENIRGKVVSIPPSEAITSPPFTIPEGYAPPVDPISNDQYLDVSADGDNMKVEVSGLTRYTFNTGYLLNDNGWEPFTFTGTTADVWIVSDAEAHIPVADLPATGYLIAYICQEISGEWICGPRTSDQNSSVQYWTIQSFEIVIPPQDGCFSMPAFNCTNHSINSSGIMITLQNKASDMIINNASMGCDANSTLPSGWTGNYIVIQNSSISFTWGQNLNNTRCNLTAGESIAAYYDIEYVIAGQTVEHVASGTVSGVVN